MILILNCCWSVKHTTESEGKDPSSSSEINMSHYMDTNSSLIDCRQKFCLFICFFFCQIFSTSRSWKYGCVWLVCWQNLCSRRRTICIFKAVMGLWREFTVLFLPSVRKINRCKIIYRQADMLKESVWWLWHHRDHINISETVLG